MRFNDLLREADQRFIFDELQDLLVRNKARGFEKISTPLIRDKLEAMGYVVDMSSLVRMLGNVAVVSNADANTITLSADSGDMPLEEPMEMPGEQPMGMNEPGTEQPMGMPGEQPMGGEYSPGPQVSPEQHRDEVVGSLASKQLSRKNA